MTSPASSRDGAARSGPAELPPGPLARAMLAWRDRYAAWARRHPLVIDSALVALLLLLSHPVLVTHVAGAGTRAWYPLLIAALLLPLGIWLTVTRPGRTCDPAQGPRPRRIPVPVLIVLASVTGCVGGIYGIGGGAILSPVLIGSGRPASEVAPAALASTFVTSLGGVATFALLSIREGPVGPNWPTGIALGIGGIAGGYLGARMQSRLPDTLIRRTLGILAIAIAARYLWSGLN